LLVLTLLAAACSATPQAERAPGGAAAATQAAGPSAGAPPAADPPAPAAEAAAAPSARTEPEKAPPRKGTVVLHVGDSFVHAGLTQRLRKLFEPLEVRYEVRAEHSTNSLDWAKRIPELVASTQPDLVIVTLGGNEIGSKHLEVQGRAVERIVKAIGGRPCVWTTPPLWMEESGLFDTIQAHLAPCRFFETDLVVGKFIPRRADAIHPTPGGGAMWADALFAWLLAQRAATGDGPSARPWELVPPPADESKPRGRRGPLPR
jgi:hypothetical protein